MNDLFISRSPDRATENAGLENAAPDCSAGVENAGVAQYGKPKSPLFNIVATATVNQKDFTHWNIFIV